MKGRWTFLRAALAVVMAAGLGFAGSSCSGDEYTGREALVYPNKASFTGIPDGGGATMPGVSAYMERRCGTLDCHGGAEIPMRLYGQLGRRAPDEGNIPGGVATTLEELEANYGAVCSVEPEKTAAQAADFGQTAEELLVVRKARGVEGHKGGTVVKEGDAADQCIIGWLRGVSLDTLTPLCQQAIDKLD